MHMIILKKVDAYLTELYNGAGGNAYGIPLRVPALESKGLLLFLFCVLDISPRVNRSVVPVLKVVLQWQPPAQQMIVIFLGAVNIQARLPDNLKLEWQISDLAMHTHDMRRDLHFGWKCRLTSARNKGAPAYRTGSETENPGARRKFGPFRTTLCVVNE
jgi:hypothetical protein